MVKPLTLGMMLFDPDYKEGDPPWLIGRGPLNGQRARRGCLSWYQPWGRCHWIAPFCWALGRKLYPELRWGFVVGKLHTVVIGFEDEWSQPVRVFDILLFRENTAEESLERSMDNGCRFYGCLKGYVASFFTDQECVIEALNDPQCVLASYCGDEGGAAA